MCRILEQGRGGYERKVGSAEKEVGEGVGKSLGDLRRANAEEEELRTRIWRGPAQSMY